jgi:hypothetical protein
MKTMHRFRKKALAITAIAACSLFFVASCKKYADLNLTPEELDSIKAQSIDYALQVIPDIHNVIPLDLIEAMNAVPDNINGKDTTICALHFGDNPPDLFKIIDTTTFGFTFERDSIGITPNGDIQYGYAILKKYVPYGPPVSSLVEDSTYYLRPFYYLFHDQHRGIAQLDFKDQHYDHPDYYVYDIAHRTDSVFIMGEKPYFTAYYNITLERKHSPGINPLDNGPRLAVILSGKITDNGIKELYYGYKVLSYTIPLDPSLNLPLPNVKDILVITPLVRTAPFQYWDPNHSY